MEINNTGLLVTFTAFFFMLLLSRYTELLERDGQFKRWCFHGRPKVFWITGFFNPQVRKLVVLC